MIHVPAAADADLLSIVEFAVAEGWLSEPVSIIRFLERPSRFTDILEAWDAETCSRGEAMDDFKSREP